MSKVAILGCGPAGLMAAHAVRNAGHQLVVMSRKRKSPLYGAQYLHEPIPGVTEPDNHIDVEYVLRGDVDMYRRKVYGPQWDGTVSPEDYIGNHRAWDIRETYDRLWAMYEPHIMDLDIDPAGVGMMINSERFDLIINTIPKQAICHQGHQFRAIEVVAAGDAPDLGIRVGALYYCPRDTVQCNGEDAPSWYRMSNIFGHTTVEWPQGIEPPLPTASKVLKPTSNNCDCWDDKVLGVGRYGSWQKGVLSHEAYMDVEKALS